MEVLTTLLDRLLGLHPPATCTLLWCPALPSHTARAVAMKKESIQADRPHRAAVAAGNPRPNPPGRGHGSPRPNLAGPGWIRRCGSGTN